VPSPIGHALAGMATGWAMEGRVTRSMTMLYAAIGVVPDLDLLVGAHSTYTHSVGAVALAFAATLALTRFAKPRVALAVAAAWASHLLLDWLGSDTSPPIGIMMLWPFSREHYQSTLYVFAAISRRYWLPEQFVWANLRAAVREVVILGPLTAISLWLNRKRT
jgi:membrane-bound metal-dependent hydrolase YbcI (DUF457 family)